MKRFIVSSIAAVALTLGAASAQAAPQLGLYLTMDGSGSITSTQFTQQITSYVNALNNVFTAAPILYGKVAIGGGIFGANFSEFFATQAINNAGDLANLTAALNGLNPGRGGINTGATAIGTAITASANSLLAYETALGTDLRLLIDVTTDGQNNQGAAPGGVAAGLVPSPINAVNCLGIGGGADCNWVGSSGTDFGNAADFVVFQRALESKLRVEFNLVPEPATLLLLGAGLFGIGFARRQRAA